MPSVRGVARHLPGPIKRSVARAFPRSPLPPTTRPSTYDEYIALQMQGTHESEKPRWAEGQRRYIRAIAPQMPQGARVLDCACGDGVGLIELRRLGFEPVGVEMSETKAAVARAAGFEVHEVDMHTLEGLSDESFDVLMSSHTLEHAFEPSRAVASLRRVLRPGGQFHVVLPFPDPLTWNDSVHVAKYELGLDSPETADRVIAYFVERGFVLTGTRRDDYREPELWLSMRKD